MTGDRPKLDVVDVHLENAHAHVTAALQSLNYARGTVDHEQLIAQQRETPVQKMERKKLLLQEALAVLPLSELPHLPFWVGEKLQDADWRIEEAQACIADAQVMIEEEASNGA